MTHIFSQARVAVPDERWDWLVAHHKPASKVPIYDPCTYENPIHFATIDDDSDSHFSGTCLLECD